MGAARKSPGANRKEESHERILAAGARAIRRSGYDGTSVADIMKEAGLTHGGFYAHFPSREAMLAEVAERAASQALGSLAKAVSGVPASVALEALLEIYLSPAHQEGIETGCPLAALASEMPRQAPEVRQATTRHIREFVDLVARQLPNWGEPGAHEQALATLSTMVGALMLARAVDDPRLSEAFRTAALEHLSPKA